MAQLVFIYGTLKRAGSHHHLMRGADFVSDVVTAPLYRLYSRGWYPAMVEDANGVCVEGELWRVPSECLKKLDAFEDLGSGEYRFEKVRLGEPWSNQEVRTYLYQRDVVGLQECGTNWSHLS